MKNASVLISGASIAGPALAYWLRRHGMHPVIVERADDLRTGGQNVDLRGAGREVARRMGIEDAIRERTTGEQGVAFIDGQGRTRAALSADSFGGEGPVAELEILRGEFAQLLYERTRDDTEYIFGDRVAALEEQGDKVRVSFLKGPEREFDLVIAADGIRSKTRGLVFGDEGKIHFLGMCIAYFTIPRHASDGLWARRYNVPEGRTLTLRPDNLGTTRAFLSFQTPYSGYEKLDPGAQKELLQQIFADVGWEAPRVLSAMEDSPDFYFESVGQVKMPRWSRGRVALVGDAGYCASPISGMGTSLALVGAYILAGELARHEDHRAAFEAYEVRMRPYVTQAQKLPPGAPRFTSPRTQAGIALGHAVLRLITTPVVSSLLSRVFSPSSEAIQLPDYPLANPSESRA